MTASGERTEAAARQAVSNAGLSDAEEALYDAYLDATLARTAPLPAAFLRPHEPVSDVLRQRVRMLHRSGTTSLDRLGPYRILRRLGEGGMGSVLLAEQEDVGRLVALKLLRPEFQDSATLAARFEREAQVVAALRHPHVVTLHGTGEAPTASGQTVRFLAMEYVPGLGLDEAVADAKGRGEPLGVARVVRWGAQVAEALQAVHDVGVVHRDVKPSNVRIREDEDTAVLLDFGIASEEAAGALTRTGRFVGTASYAAPEQLRAGVVDGRADVYSLGLTLYEALSGVRPFDGDNELQVARSVAEDEAQPLRRLRRDVPRDVEVVIARSIEKDVDRRYGSARAFAADLRAVLAGAPVAARPAGPLRVAGRLARRHPLATAAVLVALLAGPVWFAASAHRRAASAADALAEARLEIGRYVEQCRDQLQREERFHELRESVTSRYMTDEEDRAYDVAERELPRRRRERDATYHRVLTLLRAAEIGDPGLVGVGEARAELYLARRRDAEARGDVDAVALFGRLAQEAAPGSRPVSSLSPDRPVVVVSDTPGAQARVFTYVRLSELVEGGEPRLAPVPFGGGGLLQPGAWCFRLLEAHGGLPAGALVLRVDGERPDADSFRRLGERLAAGAPVTVLADGSRRDLRLSPGVRARITTQPLEWSDGPDPLREPVDVTDDEVLVVVRAPGHEEARATLVARDAGRPLRLDLLPAGTTPAGFVHVRATEQREGGSDFWVAEREVTVAEWAEFLSDAETRAAVAAAADPVLVPRRTVAEGYRMHWVRNGDGSWRPPEDWPGDWPILGISYADAEAYCAWWTRRARDRGEPWRASLPNRIQWKAVAHGHFGRKFVFGNVFRPKWVCSCYSRERAMPEPVLSYPLDESVHGVFDLAGSMQEFVAHWFDEGRGLRQAAGGTWARTSPELFEVFGGIGVATDRPIDELGLRLVLSREPEPE